MSGIGYIIVGVMFLLLFIGLLFTQKVRRREQSYRRIAQNLGRDPAELPVAEEDLTASAADRVADRAHEDMSESGVRRTFERAARR